MNTTDNGVTGSYSSDALNLDLSNFSPAVKSRYIRLWAWTGSALVSEGLLPTTSAILAAATSTSDLEALYPKVMKKFYRNAQY